MTPALNITPINQSINQLIDRSINRLINQSVSQSVASQLINLLKAKGPNGHLHRSKIHDIQ